MLALAVTVLPPFMFFADRLSLAETKGWMLGAMVVWFLSTPLWMHIKPTE
jgi:hypothetical protein